MEKFQLFARLAKYDEETGIFEAIAADESIDKAGERMDYATSKPNFEKWSNDIAKATDGKSVGNVRAMHGRTAAGILKAIECDDGAKQIRVRGQLIDPLEKAKMAAGVYTGVSVGGNYGKKWDDQSNKGVKWYTALPGEISVVDNPCNGNAHFTMVKADGMHEVEFVTGDAAKAVVESIEKSAATGEGTTSPTQPGTEATPPVAADPEKLAVDAIAKLLDDAKIKPSELQKMAEDAIAARDAETLAARTAELATALAKEDITNGDVEALAKAWNVPVDGNELAALTELSKRDFTQAERDKAADSGAAMPDGSFPIKTKDDLANAVKAYGRAKDKAAAKKHIIERAKALGATSDLPADWQDSEKAFAIDDAADALAKAALAKDMYGVAALARVLVDLDYVCQSSTYEAESEGDASPIPARLKAACDELGMILCEMCDEETGEMSAAEKAVFNGDLEKLGARHSKADLDRLQAIHDHAVGMGATCAAEKMATSVLAKAMGIESLDADLIKAWRDKAQKWDAAPAVPKGIIRATRANDNLAQDDSGGGDESAEIAKMESSNDPNLQNRAREYKILRALESGDREALSKIDPTELMKFEHKYGKRVSALQK